MTLIEEIERLRRRARDLQKEIAACSNTEAGRELAADFKGDLVDVYYRIGMLVSNSAVKVCFQ